MKTREIITLFVVRDLSDGSVLSAHLERQLAEVDCSAHVMTFWERGDGTKVRTVPALETHAVGLRRPAEPAEPGRVVRRRLRQRNQRRSARTGCGF